MRCFVRSAFVLSLAPSLLAGCAPTSDSESTFDAAFVPPPAFDAGVSPLPSGPAVSLEASTSLVPSEGAGAVDAAGPAVVAPQAPTLLPFHTGCTWTYRVTGATGTSMKVTTVGPEELVGGSGPNADERAFRVTTTKGTSDKTESWQTVIGDSVIRYREVSYAAMTGLPELEEHWAPSKLHVHSAADKRATGARWTESYQETKALAGMAPIMALVSDTWTVDAPKVKVTVPAGTFDAVVLLKSTATGSKTYWYVDGVGKVKETGGQTEELVSFDVGR